MTASEQGKWEAAALASDASSYWLLENNPHSTRGPGNLLGSVVAESRQSKTCCFVGGKGQALSKYEQGTYVLNVSISPVRLIRSVRLTSTFSLSFSSSY